MNGNSLGKASSPPTINGLAIFRRHVGLLRVGERAKIMEAQQEMATILVASVQ